MYDGGVYRILSLQGRKRPADVVARIRATRMAHGGWSPSETTRQKISTTLKGRTKNAASQTNV